MTESTASLVAAIQELKLAVRHLENTVPTLATREDVQNLKHDIKTDYALKGAVEENSKDIDTIVSDNKKVLLLIAAAIVTAIADLILKSKGVG